MTSFLWWLPSGLVVCLIWISGFLAWSHSGHSQPNFHLWMCDVGQGDAFLISRGNTQVLIDAGPNESLRHCLSSAIPWWDRHLEVIIATHPDLDHIGGFAKLEEQYTTDLVLWNGESKDTQVSQDFQAWMVSQASRGAQIKIPQEGDQLVLAADFSLEWWWPPGGKKLASSDSNAWSQVILASLSQERVVLTGDAGQAEEQYFVSSRSLPTGAILKVGHHGSETSSAENFLSTLQPQLALISVGRDNRYRHPAQSVMQRLTNVGIPILRSDELGTVHLVHDGQQWWQQSVTTKGLFMDSKNH